MNNIKRFYKLISETSYLLFLYAVGIILPLYIHNAYYDTIESKAACFKYIMYILLPFILATIIYKIITKNFNIKSFFDISLIVFALFCSISTLLSSLKKEAFTGELGWQIGLFSILCLTVTTITFKDIKIKYKYILVPIYVVYFIITIITITDGMNLDIFNFREYIAGNLYYSYFSTIGNCNWYVGYLSLFLPYFVCMFLNETDKTKSIVYYVISLLSFLSMIIIRANGIFLGLGFCALFIIPYILYDTNKIKRFLILLFGYGICLLLLNIIPSFGTILGHFDSIRTIMIDYRFIISLLLISAVLYIVVNKIKEEKYLIYRKKVIIVTEILYLVLVAGVAIYFISNNSSDLGGGRLEIWKESFDVYFNKYSFQEKLIGIGPELSQYVYINLTEKYDVLYDSSHSECIQLLLTTGIFGLLSWLTVWFSLFKSYIIKKEYNKHYLVPIYMGIFAYFGQSFVNSATILNLSTLSLFIIWLFQEKTKNKIEKSNLNNKK